MAASGSMSDALDESPHTGAGIRTQRRVVAFMPFVKLPCATPGIGEELVKRFQRVQRQPLATSEQPLRFVLRVMSVDPRSLISEVQDEPQLETRIRVRHRDAARCGYGDRFVKVLMLVTVEDTPVLIGSTTPTAPLVTHVLLSLLCGFFDQAPWRTAKVVDHNVNVGTKPAMPVFQIVPLCIALDEDIDLFPVRRGSARLQTDCASMRSSSFQDVAVATRSAASANPPSMRIGRAP